jgi:hypothetical protein
VVVLTFRWKIEKSEGAHLVSQTESGKIVRTEWSFRFLGINLDPAVSGEGFELDFLAAEIDVVPSDAFGTHSVRSRSAVEVDCDDEDVGEPVIEGRRLC